MNIQQAAVASGLTADAVRFYERKGVLPSPPRRENGYREYTNDHLVTLKLARGLRDVGLSLADIASILRVSHDGSCGDLRSTLITTLDDALVATEARIRALEQTRRHLLDLEEGLRRMHPRQKRIPGAARCACVELLVEGR